MFWAAFGFNRKTGLLPLEGDPESARGGVTSWVIYNVYENFFPAILEESNIFMHDGASVHRAYIIQDLLKDRVWK